ncbi:MAG: aminoglycoside phosphotransferase family protein [Pedobacter sp.]|nr:MAG: aminoglycoside phosphotransferase family protein [Pedobacter sp.]
MIQKVLEAFGLDVETAECVEFGDGLINHTWKVSNNNCAYILQKINTNVFSAPRDISANMVMIKHYLNQVAPSYFFVGPLATKNGDHVFESDGGVYRLFPYVPNSTAVNEVEHPDQAYQAAKQFGKFSRMLAAFNPLRLNVTIKDFHNLPFRLAQYQQALPLASKERIEKSQWAIDEIERHIEIVSIYNAIVKEQKMNLHVMHHDTKINNVLLNSIDGSGICVIDLDTMMPGYFISDVGDMMRTYLSPANEDELNISKITVRPDIFAAIYRGYMEEMDEVLIESEKDLFIYSGKFIIFMQALRFLTDYLNGDIYYRISNPDHNLNRAINQIVLLNKYIENEETFENIVQSWRLQMS